MMGKSELCYVFGLPMMMTLIGLLGCNKSKTSVYPVSGEVVFANGTPLTGGVVELRSIDSDANARGFIEEDGTFELTTYKSGDGAVQGEYQVLVQPPLPQTRDVDELNRRGLLKSDIDPKYQKYETSGLSFKVTADGSKNHLHIELQRPQN